MPSASILRKQIEDMLRNRIPSALTPVPRLIRPVASCGIASVDELLEGGLPLGAITEMVGPECSGRTSFALSFLSQMTQAGKVCAWVDVSDGFHPESAAAAGIDLPRLLWVRCGVVSGEISRPSGNDFGLPAKYLIPPPVKKGLHGGGCGGHPRDEVKGLSYAVGRFLQSDTTEPESTPPKREVGAAKKIVSTPPSMQSGQGRKFAGPGKPWIRIEQALRVADLLLLAGGFSAIVLDMGSVAPEHALRVPLATWFRYRAAAEKSQSSILLLTQQACAKSCAGLVLHLQSASPICEETTVFTEVEYRMEVARERFKPTPANVLTLRKPPQRMTETSWHSRAAWAGPR